MGILSRLAAVAGKRIDCKSVSPIVSFTFDDAPLSSFTAGGKILEDYGFFGTYYISAGLINKMTVVGQIADMKTIIAFHEQGHEIGNHTYDHLDCQKAGPVGVVKNIWRNRKMLNGVVSGNFAYPHGSRDARARVATGLCTSSARGIFPGINRDVIDLTDLKAAKVYDRHGIDACLDLVSECATGGGWLIFYTHDVCDEPSEYGCRPAQLSRLVQAVQKNGLTVEPVGKAMAMILAQTK